MLAKIQDIQQFETAVQWMQAGQSALQVGMVLTLILLGLSVASVILKDERLTHAARRGQYAMLALTAFCSGLLYLGIFDGYYFVNYVSHVTENNELLQFKISALWASQSGSLLFWCLILTSFSSAFAFSQRHNRTDRRLPYTLAVLAVVQFFFFFILVSPTSAEAAQRSSPFSLSYYWMSAPEAASTTMQAALQGGTLKAPAEGWAIVRAFIEAGHGDWTLGHAYTVITTDAASLPKPVQMALLDGTSDGGGLNPALHNYWIAIHPPMLYCGFVGFTIPFAYAVGSLLSGEVSEGWLKPIRLWTMGAWGFLTVGIALGGLWAYEILGWGGYWAWDPVENASFIPWLTGTAFIHSVIVTERRGMLRAWSFALIIVTYCMTVIGTFLVRSGIINSVHAFGATGDVDVWFYAFLGIVFMGSLLAVIWRAPLLKSDRKLESLASREASFLFNNLIFVFIAAVTLVVTFWPWITEKLYGENGTEELGQNAFVMINAPLLLFVLLLMGIGPALAWRRNNAKQMLRAFLPPSVAGIIVGIINFIWLHNRDLLITPEAGGTIATFASEVRLGMQLLLWPVCTFTMVCIVMEFMAGARARRRNTGENILTALVRITLGNRRRYGGYIVHVGVLLIALGIYYSSLYEVSGSVTTSPGGYSLITDKLSGDKYIVYFESEETTDDWDFLRESFGQDEQRAQIYENMLRYVRKNPDKSAGEIVEKVRQDAKDQFGGELPEFFTQNALPRMIAAVHWGVKQRENTKVYESFNTIVRVFPYVEPTDLEIKPYLDAHDRAQSLLYGDSRDGGEFNDRSIGLTVARWQVQSTQMLGGSFTEQFRARRELVATISAEELPALTGLDQFGFGEASDEDIERVRQSVLAAMTDIQKANDALILEGVKLGPQLITVNEQIRETVAALPQDRFATVFGLRTATPEEYATGRFNALKELERFHLTIERESAARRNQLVVELAPNIGDEATHDQLKALRPLSLTGLKQARETAEGNVAAAIDAEIETIVSDSTRIEPRMRIFYDKRSGSPRMNEPVKDPYYHRTLDKDLYFILQDSRPDGTATFRYFIKPMMSVGMAGLGVIILGIILAFLPNMRRRRPEVA
ncbi:MAG: cytochrome c biogenesis protein CcsA [Planctomycetota bacterium]